MSADPNAKPSRAARLLPFLVPVAALLVCLPLFRQGCSCGHDISFHLASWLDAAQQLRHGTLYPVWDYSAAWNAGEPRFIFYPPISWMLGELLTLTLPFRLVPAIYTWIALSAAGLSMFAVTRRLTAPSVAFVLSALYMANPYMLFTALERTAYAELLSAAWIPLLLFAALRDRPTIKGIAIPLALLWLTNAPAAVMGSYALAIVAGVRVYIAYRRSRMPGEPRPLVLAMNYIVATVLGLTLPAIYLIPAAYERRFVEISMALVPGLSFPANFLFTRTGDAAHDHVVHQVSLIALTLLALSLFALVALFAARRDRLKPIAGTVAALGLLAALIALLLTPISSPIWAHAPELAFLQFPWRWLMVLAPALIVLLALLTRALGVSLGARAAIPLGLAVAILLGFPISKLFLQACPASDQPAVMAALFRSGHGVPPTDEYTPNNADNDFQRSDEPAFWLSDDPQAFAPNTAPNPNATAPDVDFGEPDPAHTLSHRPAPRLEITAPHAEYLIFNLRDYPNWDVGIGCATCVVFNDHLQHVQRDDGLLAVALPAGGQSVSITWHTGRDRLLGGLVSLLALAGLLLLDCTQTRKISAEHAV
jgi:hypothetical protein